MKLFLLLSLAVATNGFVPMTMARTKTSSLQGAASGIGDMSSQPESVAARPVSEKQLKAMKAVVIDPDYTLAWQVAALCPLIISYHPCKCSLVAASAVSASQYFCKFSESNMIF
jgi:hypothetical protein